GEYRLPGNVSSQFFTGLLFALPLLEGDSRIAIEGKLESAGYIDMTLDALSLFGIKIERGEDYFAVPGGQKYNTPLDLYEALNEDYYSDADNATTASPDPVWLPAEGDWSNSAFWLCAGATRGEIAVRGLSYPSLQGDSAVVEILRRFGADVKDEEVHYKEDSNAVKKETFHDFIGTLPGELLWNKKKDEDNGPGTQEFVPAAISVNAYYELEGITIDVSDIPDLVPALAVTAMAAKGRTTFTNAGRLRLKESDRIASVCAAVNALGGKAFAEGDSLIIEGGERPKGGTVDACGDHRIAMLAAVAAQWCSGPVTILGAEAVDKSYPNFWRDYASLGGYVTLYEEV
ncbi:MAG: hypothetical protein J6Z30_00390, partial [Pyramidobacter sp.]|nr:hypothetical protein [Pyramidobacter sp.]